jgi:prevent-host-death family protein
MSRIAVIEARKVLADILNRASYGKERVVLTRRGKDVAAIVSMDDFATLEEIEDRMDVLESTKVLKRVRVGSEKLVALSEVKAKYGATSTKSRRAKGKGAA